MVDVIRDCTEQEYQSAVTDSENLPETEENICTTCSKIGTCTYRKWEELKSPVLVKGCPGYDGEGDNQPGSIVMDIIPDLTKYFGYSREGQDPDYDTTWRAQNAVALRDRIYDQWTYGSGFICRLQLMVDFTQIPDRALITQIEYHGVPYTFVNESGCAFRFTWDANQVYPDGTQSFANYWRRKYLTGTGQTYLPWDQCVVGQEFVWPCNDIICKITGQEVTKLMLRGIFDTDGGVPPIDELNSFAIQYWNGVFPFFRVHYTLPVIRRPGKLAKLADILGITDEDESSETLNLE